MCEVKILHLLLKLSLTFPNLHQVGSLGEVDRSKANGPICAFGPVCDCIENTRNTKGQTIFRVNERHCLYLIFFSTITMQYDTCSEEYRLIVRRLDSIRS